MADAKNPIPSTQPGDSDDVELALETAQRLYRTGDHAEALKWLRRAANAAEEAGDDMRQLQLARAAADLTATISTNPQVVTSAPSVPPTAKSALPSPTPSRLPQPPSKQPPPAPSNKPSVVPGPVAPAKPSAAATTSGTPQPPSAASSGPPPLPAKGRPSPPSVTPAPGRASESQPPPPQLSDSITPLASKPAVSSKSKSAEPFASPAPVVTPSVMPAKPTMTATPSVAPVKADKPMSATSTSSDMGAALHGAIRVSVRTSARDDGLYIVRPLPQGQKVPPGSREARLVFDQDG